jgi:DNA invertase Pin-like site-specific DNA recombinase
MSIIHRSIVLIFCRIFTVVEQWERQMRSERERTRGQGEKEKGKRESRKKDDTA